MNRIHKIQTLMERGCWFKDLQAALKSLPTPIRSEASEQCQAGVIRSDRIRLLTAAVGDQYKTGSNIYGGRLQYKKIP